MGPIPTRFQAQPERVGSAITFPRLVGYRYDIGEDRITAQFTSDSKIVLSPQDIPTRVEVAPVIGEHAIHTIDDLKRLRNQQVVFLLAKLVLQKFFQDEVEYGHRTLKSWVFPQVLLIAGEWYRQCVDCKDDAFPQ